MESSEQNDLEKFIHAQLQKLPEREAPEILAVNVMAAIAARKNLPWWKQPFTHWPRNIQSVLFVALAAIFGTVLYGTNRAANVVSVPDVSEHLSTFAWVGTIFRSVGESLFLAIRSLGLEWFIGFAVIFALLYGVCLVAGFALFKVTTGTASRAA